MKASELQPGDWIYLDRTSGGIEVRRYVQVLRVREEPADNGQHTEDMVWLQIDFNPRGLRPDWPTGTFLRARADVEVPNPR